MSAFEGEVVNGRYVPVNHTGTVEEQVQGLLSEAFDIYHNGCMREFAASRELGRIQLELRELGYLMYESDDPYPDRKWIFGARKMDRPHGPKCLPPGDEDYCECEPDFKSKGDGDD
jgi:hypothetical protein